MNDFIKIESYSIAIAAIIGLIRLSKIHRAYQPFIFITVAALLSEIGSRLVIEYYHTNAITNNILSLVETVLWLWQFRRWDSFRKSKWQYPIILCGLLSLWSVENVVLGKLWQFSSVYAITYSFCLVFLSISQVNKQIVEEKRNLFRNSKFLICSGAIIFYTYRILIECFWLLELDGEGQRFLTNIFIILAFVNLFVNLLFALATLWIPTRQRFSMPSS